MTETTKPVAKMTKAELMALVAHHQENAEARAASKVTGWTVKQQLGAAIAAVAGLLVVLSVYHLTCAVATLTGSPIILALLLAVGIDVGLVASEFCELLCHEARRWSKIYMGMATVMSMVLNAYEFAAHAPEGWLSQCLSVGFGLALPVMVWILARQAITVWQSK